jgi:hypothetical protein
MKTKLGLLFLVLLIAVGCDDSTQSDQTTDQTTDPPTVQQITPTRPRQGKTQTEPLILTTTERKHVITHVDKALGLLALNPLVPGITLPLLFWKKTFDYFNDDSKVEKQFMVGKIRFASVLYGGRILTTATFQDFKKQWGDHFDLQLIKIPIACTFEEAEGVDFGKLLNALEIELSFDDDDNGNSVQIINRFPENTFEASGHAVNGSFGVGVGGFVPLGTAAKASVDAKIGYKFNYTPLIAKVTSYGLGTTAGWKLKRVGDDRPFGQQDYYCTVLVPHEMRKTTASLKITFWLDEKDNSKVTRGPYSFEVDFGDPTFD